ncbi:MAG: hypothetical protein R3E39_06760 [Anaerolineae bacterium]
MFILTGCIARIGEINIHNTVEPSTSPTPAFTTQTPSLGSDASLVVDGVCFEAASQNSGRIFVIRDAIQLGQFYDQLDSSKLCRHPITRHEFSFDDGAVLVGLWSAGNGCTARHEIVQSVRDDTERKISLILKFTTDGQCNYELVRPFWIALKWTQDYQIDIKVNSE